MRVVVINQLWATILPYTITLAIRVWVIPQFTINAIFWYFYKCGMILIINIEWLVFAQLPKTPVKNLGEIKAIALSCLYTLFLGYLLSISPINICM